jgi:hypothetical protein
MPVVTTRFPVGLVCVDSGCIRLSAPPLRMPPPIECRFCRWSRMPPIAVRRIAARTTMEIISNIFLFRFSIFIMKFSRAAVTQDFICHMASDRRWLAICQNADHGLSIQQRLPSHIHLLGSLCLRHLGGMTDHSDSSLKMAPHPTEGHLVFSNKLPLLKGEGSRRCHPHKPKRHNRCLRRLIEGLGYVRCRLLVSLYINSIDHSIDQCMAAQIFFTEFRDLYTGRD